ncbi:MAG: NifB/NifX family molybdenum-iron cluster-binding protein [Bacillota bacterium]
MRIAIASEGNMVSEHFGHCEGFEVVDVNENEVKNRIFLENPGHKPGFLPVYLAGEGVKMIVSGGMGATAQELFKQNGISVITGIQGSLDHIIENFMNGQLQSTGSVCQEHMHYEHCHG